MRAACADAIAKGEAPPKRAKRKDPTSSRNFKAATPGALVLCPTRELAQQVANDAIDLVRHCRGLRIANVVGGMPYQLQIAKLQNADLVVATPGRLLDLQRSMQLKLDQVQFLVVDEADRMLDLGFADDLAEVNQLTIERRQTMMFSATLAPRIQQLAARVMREPQRVQIDSPQEKHANIKQVLFWADNAQHKRKLLDHWLRDTTINQAIIFASTQIECDGLANDLQQDGFDAVALHGALNQGLRNRRLMALRNGQVQFLVATDVAARGIDVPTHHPRLQLRFADEGRGLHPPHRPHRPCRPRRPGRHLCRNARPPQDFRHRGLHPPAPSRPKPCLAWNPSSAPHKVVAAAAPVVTLAVAVAASATTAHVTANSAHRAARPSAALVAAFGGGGGGFNQRDERPAFGGDRFGGDRHAPRGGDFAPRGDAHAPRGGEFADRRPAFGKPMAARPAPGGQGLCAARHAPPPGQAQQVRPRLNP